MPSLLRNRPGDGLWTAVSYDSSTNHHEAESILVWVGIRRTLETAGLEAQRPNAGLGLCGFASTQLIRPENADFSNQSDPTNTQ